MPWNKIIGGRLRNIISIWQKTVSANDFGIFYSLIFAGYIDKIDWTLMKITKTISARVGVTELTDMIFLDLTEICKGDKLVISELTW